MTVMRGSYYNDDDDNIVDVSTVFWDLISVTNACATRDDMESHPVFREIQECVTRQMPMYIHRVCITPMRRDMSERFASIDVDVVDSSSVMSLSGMLKKSLQIPDDKIVYDPITRRFFFEDIHSLFYGVRSLLDPASTRYVDIDTCIRRIHHLMEVNNSIDMLEGMSLKSS